MQKKIQKLCGALMLAVLMAVMFFAGCSDPMDSPTQTNSGAAGIRLILAGQAPRTLFPSETALSYKIAAKKGSDSETIIDAAWTGIGTEEFALAPGTWTITVTGYLTGDGTGDAVSQGTASVELQVGDTDKEVSVTLSRLKGTDGEGILVYGGLKLDSITLSGLKSAKLTVTPKDEGGTAASEIDLRDSDYTTDSKLTLKSGSYILKVVLEQTGGSYIVRSEAAQIFKDRTTKISDSETLDFKAADFSIKLISVALTKNQTTYDIGDSLFKTRMEVIAAYSDASTRVVSSWSVTGFDTATVGEKTVTVSYTDGGDTVSTSFTITVKAEAFILITSSADMEKIGVDSGFPLMGKYKLNADITLANWNPIGSDIEPFAGTFDGDGHTITLSGFGIAALSTTYLGIFASVKGVSDKKAKINSLKIASTVNNTSTFGSAQMVGLLAGYTEYADIEDITLSGTFAYNNTSKDVFLGGIAGYSQAGTIIKDCKSSMTLDIQGGKTGHPTTPAAFALTDLNYVGGFIGVFKGTSGTGVTIENCRNTGNITVTGMVTGSQFSAGGTAGGSYYSTDTSAYHGEITSCSFDGNITINGMGAVNYAGGIAGYIVGGKGQMGTTANTPERYTYTTPTKIFQCEAKGTITVKQASSGNAPTPMIGGIVGAIVNGALISQCSFDGAIDMLAGPITGMPIVYVGGIAGFLYQANGATWLTKITDCWSSGTIKGYANAGGIVGQISIYNTNIGMDKDWIQRCYSRAAVSVIVVLTGDRGVGGISGQDVAGNENKAIIADCVALNPSLTTTGSNYGRVSKIADVGNCYAYSAMIITANGSSQTSDAVNRARNKKDGKDCAEKPEWLFYTNSIPANATSGTDGLGWSALVWKMGGDGYPRLQWQN